MSTQTSSRLNRVVSKITKAANKAVKTKDAIKSYRQKSIKSFQEIPSRHASMNSLKMV
ncbi:MAG: hypothetical protein ACJAYJ_000254 [Saprospiraceae bacterium]|jgi:hypothetical protein